MSFNLLSTVQENLGYPALQKVDPNTQEVIMDEKTPDEDRFSQAAIPAVLIGLFSYVQSDEGATEFLLPVYSFNWMDKLFLTNKKEVIQSVAEYAKQSNADVITKMNRIADEAVKEAKGNLTGTATIKDVKSFFSKQKNTILPYLPAALNMGGLLHDTTLDDNTNKMEGPISNLIQSIGAAFSTPVTDDEIRKQ